MKSQERRNSPVGSIAEINFSDKYLGERWSGVKEDFWGDLKKETVIALKRLLETSMEVEVQDLIGSPHWKHNPGRLTYRNGYYSRSLLTGFGYLADLRVPRIREGGIKFCILGRYQRRSEDLDHLVLEMFLSGVSTRRVEEVLVPLLGERTVSAGLVSKITKVLDKQVERFHSQRLKDEYTYLILDGIFLNQKSPVWKKRRCILVAYGMKLDGKRELIDFEMANQGESENAWEGFLNRLYQRGLEGKNLKLVVIDGNKGLANALSLIYPFALKQRCWAHKLRNVANKCPKKLHEVCIQGAREIYKQKSYSRAIEAYKKWAGVWRGIVPEAVKCLEDDLEELLNFYSIPEKLWIKLRTTNIIERAFREVRRRTRPMSCFQNRASVERIIFAIFYRLNKKWGNGKNSLFYEITQDY
jgi:transposase-like protein